MRLAALASRQTNVVRRHVGHAGKCQRPSLRRAAVETRALFNFGSNNAQKNQGPTRADYDEQEVRLRFSTHGIPDRLATEWPLRQAHRRNASNPAGLGLL